MVCAIFNYFLTRVEFIVCEEVVWIIWIIRMTIVAFNQAIIVYAFHGDADGVEGGRDFGFD